MYKKVLLDNEFVSKTINFVKLIIFFLSLTISGEYGLVYEKVKEIK
jgi:hypothetical protein